MNSLSDEILDENFQMSMKQSINGWKTARIFSLFIAENQSCSLLSAELSSLQTGGVTLT